MRTFYVNAERGYTGATGLTESDPVKTIAEINTKISGSIIQNGDRILFAKGQTFDDATLTLSLDSLTVSGYGSGDRPILDGDSARTPLVISGDDNIVSGISIRNGAAPGSGNDGIQLSGTAARNTIESVDIVGGFRGISLVSTPTGEDNIIENFSISGCDESGFYTQGTGVDRIILRNGTIDGCGLTSLSTSKGQALKITGTTDVQIINVAFNTITHSYLSLGEQTTEGTILFEGCRGICRGTSSIFGVAGGDHYKHTSTSGTTTMINCAFHIENTDKVANYIISIASGTNIVIHSSFLSSNFQNTITLAALVVGLGTGGIQIENTIMLSRGRKHPYIGVLSTCTFAGANNLYGDGDWAKGYNPTGIPGSEVDHADWVLASNVVDDNPVHVDNFQIKGDLDTLSMTNPKDLAPRTAYEANVQGGKNNTAIYTHDILNQVRTSANFGIGPIVVP